ncbi:hypothetical protein ABIC02_007645 [Bradyrhizobium sp. RT5a]
MRTVTPGTVEDAAVAELITGTLARKPAAKPVGTSVPSPKRRDCHEHLRRLQLPGLSPHSNPSTHLFFLAKTEAGGSWHVRAELGSLELSTCHYKLVVFSYQGKVKTFLARNFH